jgi:hypothetical protein
MESEELTLDKIFQKTRKPKAMRLTEYEDFIRGLIRT